MVDEIKESIAGIANEMRRRDPFLAFMMLVGGLLVGWYVYQQQVMNEKLIQLQIESGVDGREKVATIQSLVAAQNRTAEIAEKAMHVQERGTQSIVRLADIMTDERVFNVGTRALVLDAMHDAKVSSEDTAKSVHELVDHIKARDATE